MSITRGKCSNRKRCTTANSGRVIDVSAGTAFICPECGAALKPFRATLGTPLPVGFVVFLALQVACFGCMAWTWVSRAGVYKVFASTTSTRLNPELIVVKPREQNVGTSAQAADAHIHREVVSASSRSAVNRRGPAVSRAAPEPVAQPAIVMRTTDSTRGSGDAGKNHCIFRMGCKAVGQAPLEEMQAPAVSELLANASSRFGQAPDWVVDTPIQMPTEALQVSSGVSGGQIIRRVAPVYPEQARTERIQGTVILAITIVEDGTVAQATVLSGPTPLANAARQAVRQWRYSPFELNGKPVAMHSQVTIHFKLP